MRARHHGLLMAACLAALLAATQGCRSNPWKRELLYVKDGVATYLERKEIKGTLVPQGFAHPGAVSPTLLSGLLASLRFHSSGPLREEREEAVFQPAEVAGLAGPLADALGRAGSDERVRFLAARTRWRALFLGPLGVSGVAFLDAPDRLNLAFDLLNEGLSDEDADPRALVFYDDPVEITGRKPEIIAPAGTGLRPGAPEGSVHPRWLVADLKAVAAALPPPAPPTASGASPAPPPASGDSIAEAVKRKLKALDKLRADGAITAEEHERARREILSKLEY